MRVLVLCKRQYTGKDLLSDRYGRLFELPVELARRGHDMAVLAASYRPKGDGNHVEQDVSWHSVDVLRSPLGYRSRLLQVIARMRPEVLWVSSDALHVINGVRLGRRLGIPVVADLYDDYESFGLTSVLGLGRLFRRACSEARALSVVSHTLAATVRDRSANVGLLEVIGNGVPTYFTDPLPRDEARRLLGLPLDIHLVGVAGALDASRGIEDLLSGFAHLSKRRPDVGLVLAGPRDRAVAKAIAGKKGVIDLGLLAHDRVPWLYSALDVGVVCNRDGAFGQACHPQKLVEMIACGLPVVVAAVGDSARLLGEESLYPPGDSSALADRVERQLAAPMKLPSALAPRWDELAIKLEGLLQQSLEDHQVGPVSS